MDVNGLKKLSVKGYRKLLDMELEMRPFAVLIGANGSGKTSILELMELLSRAATGHLNDFVVSHGGFRALLTRKEITELVLSVEMTYEPPENIRQDYDIRHDQARYTLRLAEQGYGYRIVDEYAGYDKHNFLGDPFLAFGNNDISHEALLSHLRGTRINSDLNPIWDAYATQFASASYFASNFKVNGVVKEAQRLTPTMSPGGSGEFLLSYLYNLREQHPEAYKELERVLASAFPLFTKLTLPLVANGTVGLEWWEERLSGSLSSFQLSEGTLRFVWLAAALLMPEPPAITVIDEPETSLHPELLRLLVSLMRDASRRTQLIVATHSDRLVTLLDPAEVVIMDATEDDFAMATWADTLDLDEWLQEYTLGEVWRKGIMGGRAR